MSVDSNEEKWNYVYNGTTQKVYWNDMTDSVTESSGLFDSSSTLRVADFEDWGPSNTRLNGAVDQMRIYNRSLPHSEIQRLKSVNSEEWAVNGCKLTG